MPKIAHIDNHEDEAGRKTTNDVNEVARHTIDQGIEAARESVGRAQRTIDDAAADQREIALRTSEDLTEAGRMVTELYAEQTRHAAEAASAIWRAVDWSGIFAAQRDFVTASLDRMRQLNDRQRELAQIGLKALTFPARRH